MRPFQIVEKFTGLIPEKAKLTALVFDKVQFVPKVKGIEQRQRNISKKDVMKIDCDESTRFLDSFNVITPDEWAGIIADRKARNWLIHEIGMQLIQGYNPQHPLILDGMILDDETLPVLLEPQPLNEFDPEAPRPVKRLNRNKVGEADIAVKLYIRYALDTLEGPLSIQINTQDSDLIMILLMYYDSFDDATKTRLSLWIKFGKQKLVGSKSNEKVHMWMNIGKLHGMIIKDLPENMVYSIPYFCTMCMSSGNDYVDGLPSVDEERTFRCIFQYAPLIGDIFDDSSMLRWACYKRMTMFLMLDFFNGGNKGSKNTLPKSIETCTWDDLVSLVKSRFANPKQHVPSRGALYAQYQRMQWNIIYIISADTTDPSVIDQMSLQLGFSNEKPEEPLGFHNTQRVLSVEFNDDDNVNLHARRTFQSLKRKRDPEETPKE